MQDNELFVYVNEETITLIATNWRFQLHFINSSQILFIHNPWCVFFGGGGVGVGVGLEKLKVVENGSGADQN